MDKLHQQRGPASFKQSRILILLSLGAALGTGWSAAFFCSYSTLSVVLAVLVSCLVGGFVYAGGRFASRGEMQWFVKLTALMYNAMCVTFGLGESITWEVHQNPQLDVSSYPTLEIIIALSLCLVALLIWGIKIVTKEDDST